MSSDEIDSVRSANEEEESLSSCSSDLEASSLIKQWKSAKGNKRGTKRERGRKAVWSDESINDMVDIVTSNERFKRKLIFENYRNSANTAIYLKIKESLDERELERNEGIFYVKQIRNKFKKCSTICKKACLTIQTAKIKTSDVGLRFFTRSLSHMIVASRNGGRTVARR